MMYDAGREPCLLTRMAGARCESRSSDFRFDSTSFFLHLCRRCAEGDYGENLVEGGYRKVPIEGVTFVDAASFAEEQAYAEWGATCFAWRTADGAERVTCRLCGHDAADSRDVRDRYCIRCNRYHVPARMPRAEQMRYAQLNMPPSRWTGGFNADPDERRARP